MSKMQVYCDGCGQLTELSLSEHKRKHCKGKPAPKPEPSVEQPEPVSSVPESEPVGEPRSEYEDGQGSLYGDTKEKRNKRAREWRERNREKHREYMREYMKAKRANGTQ